MIFIVLARALILGKACSECIRVPALTFMVNINLNLRASLQSSPAKIAFS